MKVPSYGYLVREYGGPRRRKQFAYSASLCMSLSVINPFHVGFYLAQTFF